MLWRSFTFGCISLYSYCCIFVCIFTGGSSSTRVALVFVCVAQAVLSAGADFVFCTHCDGCSLFYLLGQISCFVHVVMALASFYLLGQISCFVHAVMAVACFICWGRFRVLYTL